MPGRRGVGVTCGRQVPSAEKQERSPRLGGALRRVEEDGVLRAARRSGVQSVGRARQRGAMSSRPPVPPTHTLPVSRGWTLASSLTSFERRAPWRPLPPTPQPADRRARWWREGSTCSVIRVRTPRLCLSSHSASATRIVQASPEHRTSKGRQLWRQEGLHRAGTAVNKAGKSPFKLIKRIKRVPACPAEPWHVSQKINQTEAVCCLSACQTRVL